MSLDTAEKQKLIETHQMTIHDSFFTFLNENSKHRKQDGTAAIISKFLEASLDETDKNKQFVKVGWTESSLRSMVYGDKVR